MKLDNQIKYFINGIILIFLGLYSVTYLPGVIKLHSSIIIANYVFYQIEFFLLVAGAIFFLFSPRYYKWQMVIIVFAIFYYCLFSQFRLFL